MSVYENVKFAKSEGTLVVSNTDITFKMGEKSLKLPWSTIAKHQVNPKTQPKALLKLMLQNGKPAKLFQLANRDDSDKISTEIFAHLKEPTEAAPKPKAAATKPAKRPSAKAAPSSASAAAKVYQSVICRNMEGSLHLFENQLKFEAKADPKKAFSVPYAIV